MNFIKLMKSKDYLHNIQLYKWKSWEYDHLCFDHCHINIHLHVNVNDNIHIISSSNFHLINHNDKFILKKQ